ncbi:MAG: S8 family peptidase [Bacteroidales bacterium]|nr:S8 family peptidase [Bacteroidales bacterium]
MMKNYFFLFFFAVSSLVFGQKQKLRDATIPGLVIVKTTTDISLIKDKQFSDFLNKISATPPAKRFPNAQKPQKEINRYHQKLVDLTKIYEIHFDKKFSPETISKQLKSFSFVVYAQPYYLPELLYVPNDSLVTSQYALTRIHAFDGWDNEKGDSTIIIGITDTGVDLDHEELHDQIAYNPNDPPNGVDDDYDGFTDNFRGWDLGENDNNPQWDESGSSNVIAHGVYVSSLAAAHTDNGKGIAGVGFNTKFLPVKISNEWGVLNRSYEGIVYAADHGCSIINCSWGGVTESPYGQDIVNYATYNRNALVVAAAGNSWNDVLFYPASYENVLCVAATNPSDEKWNKSSYGIYVDVCAPGDNVLLALADNEYTGGWGTSFASPQVAGLAALVKAHYPDTLSALQIGEIIKVTCNYIDTIPYNQQFSGLLGAGLIDCGKALSNTITPSIQFRNILYNGQDSTIFPGNDTITIAGDFINYLTPTQNLEVTLQTASPYIQILDSSFSAGAIETLDSVSNQSSPFRIALLPSAPYDETIDLKLIFTDTATNYSGFQYLRIIVSPSYLDIYPNNISTTITSNGRIGFNRFSPLQGIGFLHNSYAESLLYESGLLIASFSDHVSDCVRGGDDFLPIVKPAENNIPPYSDMEYNSQFDDSKTDSTKLDMLVDQTVYAWTDSSRANTIWFRYQIINQSGFDYNNIFFGNFTDWDIIDFAHNIMVYDSLNHLAYCYDVNNQSVIAGVQMLSNYSRNVYGIDNISGGDGVIDIYDGFTDDEKYYTLSHTRATAGGTTGMDVAQMVSYGPFVVNQNDTLDVFFAFVADNSIQKIQNTAQANQLLFDSLFAQTNYIENQSSAQTQIQIFPNPANDILTIEGNFNLEEINKITIFDVSGRIVKPLVCSKNKNIQLNISQLSSGIYFIKVTTGNKIINLRFTKN